MFYRIFAAAYVTFFCGLLCGSIGDKSAESVFSSSAAFGGCAFLVSIAFLAFMAGYESKS